MKKNIIMRKAGAVVLSACLAAGMLAGCGKNNQSAASAEGRLTFTEEIESVMPEFDDIFVPADGNAEAETDTPAFDELVGENGAEFTADYLMIYNPNIYDTYADNSPLHTSEDVLYTGGIADQIVTGVNRAGEPELEERAFVKISQDDPEIMGDDEMIPSGLDVRANSTDPTYSKGDKHDFWHGFSSERKKDTFNCLYAGINSYIWSLNDSISPKQAEQLGRELDRNIYEQDVNAFGIPRFTENGGKLNVLVYPMEGGICGFFSTADIWSTAEVKACGYSPDDVRKNTDHAIINVNSYFVKNDMQTAYSTLAHELQHNICASDAFYYAITPWMRSWLNEAMSAYAEELVYPGSMFDQQYNLDFYDSEDFRSGQSLYNFQNVNDIGSYGAVFLFEEYLRQNIDADPFFAIHEFWRTAGRADMDEAQATSAASTADFIDRINNSVIYTPVMEAKLNPEEEWMSKLTLNFYLETLTDNLGKLNTYRDRDNMTAGNYWKSRTIYTNAEEPAIEGGGRIIVWPEDGTFKVPETASDGLIYVTLDKDFNCTGIYDSVGTPLQ